MVKTLIKWVVAMVLAMLVFSYIVNPTTLYQVKDFFSEVKSKIASTAQKIPTQTELSYEEKAKELCIERVKEDYRTQKIKSPIDFSYTILEVKEFDSLAEAAEYRKKYTTVDLADPLCWEQSVSKVVAVMGEIRYGNFVEPLTGTRIDKETTVMLCNENGEYLERGYSWECKEKIKQKETEELTEEPEEEEMIEEEEKHIVDSMQLVSKSIITEDSCKIQCTAACDKKGYSYHSSTYEEETACKCNCAYS